MGFASLPLALPVPNKALHQVALRLLWAWSVKPPGSRCCFARGMPPASPKLSLCVQHRSSPQPCALLWVPAAARPSQLSPPPPLPPGGVSAPGSRTSRMGGRERSLKLGWVRWHQAGGCLGLGTADPPRTAPSQHPQGSGPQLVSSAGSPAPCGCLSSPLLRHNPNHLKTLQKKRESAPSPGCAPCLACPTAQPQVLCPGGCSPRWENGNSPTLPTTTSQPGHGPILHSRAKPPRSTREPPPSTTRCCGVSPSHPIPSRGRSLSPAPSAPACPRSCSPPLPRHSPGAPRCHGDLLLEIHFICSKVGD